ncbi:MAG TPA: FeoB-associated Cys-rich membrane protein [Lacunisphaera sp.]|nr:FeoB-associated Cys-rich membrane protein [Lacunisphaera sp.]
MTSSLQTIIALALVALAVAFLARSWFPKRKNPGCGGNCGAVSPEVKQLQAKLRR